MVRMGPTMGPRLGPTLGPNPAAGDPLVGFSQTFTTQFGDGFLIFGGNFAMATGSGPFRASSDGTLPDPLAPATDYWLVSTLGDDGLTDTYQIAASEADALAHISITLNDDGTGTHTLTYVG